MTALEADRATNPFTAKNHVGFGKMRQWSEETFQSISKEFDAIFATKRP